MPVYAVGGSASVGKTTVAAHLAEILGGSPIIHVDDLVQQAEPEGFPPFLHSTVNPWQQPGAALATKLIEWTARLHPVIIDAAEALHRDGLVIEGEGLDPRLIQQWSQSVSVVYVIEDDRDVLWQTFATGRPSSGRFCALGASEQSAVVEMNLCYGHWLREAAQDAGQPWVPSRPWPSLARRCTSALGIFAEPDR